MGGKERKKRNEKKKIPCRKKIRPEKRPKAMSDLSDNGYDIEEIAEAFEETVNECAEKINRYRVEKAYREMAKGKIYEHIDMGKVGALTRAGWSLKKIGEEFSKNEREMGEIINEWIKDTGKGTGWPEALLN